MSNGIAAATGRMKLGRFKVMSYIKPLLPFVPEVTPPERRIYLREKIMWTLACLAIFMICSQVPLYGLGQTKGNDPLYWLRVIMASNRGTLMELGIAPIVTSGMVLQFLQGSGILFIDEGLKEDRVLFQSLQKFAGIAFTLAQAVMYVSSGMYGDVTEIGSSNATLIIAQLTFSGVVVTLLDEVLQKGYGLGSGINLFIAANICETVLWKMFSPATIQTPHGGQFEGAVLSFLYQLIFSSHKMLAIQEAFYRPYGANLMNIVATVVVICAMVYLTGFRIDIPIRNVRGRGAAGNYPIKLFYTSSMPIILYGALISNIYFFSQLVSKRFKGSLLTGITGVWQEVDWTGESVPVGGIVYYMSPPMSVYQMITDPFRTTIYFVFYLGACAWLSKAWIDISGEAPRDVMRRLKEQNVSIVGYRDTETMKVLQKYIPPMAMLGGSLIGVISLMGDLLGCIGSGTGILLCISMTMQYWEQMSRDREFAS